MVSRTRIRATMLMKLVARARSRHGAGRCLSRLRFLTRATKTRIIGGFARGLPATGSMACIKGKGLRRVGRCVLGRRRGRQRMKVIVFSSRLSTGRVHGVRTRLGVGVLSHASLVLSVFTVHTRATGTGARIRLTRCGCVLPHLRHL